MSQPAIKLKDPSLNDKQSSRLPAQRHLTSGSIDTNASGLADSTISYAGSLHLGRFPAPPLSIPTTPVTSDYSPSSTGSGFTYHTGSTAPLNPRRKQSNATTPASSSTGPKHRPLPSIKSNISAGSNKSAAGFVHSQPSSPRSRTISPYDWHEGASSIDVDAAEDRLLPTNFITSLLRENSPPSSARRTSISSDAYSGFSEMTYPPVMRYPGPSERPPPLPIYPAPQSPRTHPSLRPQGARPPPTAFSPIPEAANHVSDDSDTLASNSEFTTVIRSASISRGLSVAGASVVGMAPATLHRYSSGSPTEVRVSSAPSDDRTLSYGPFTQFSSYHESAAIPSSSLQATFHRDNARRTDSRQSIHSTRSFVPSVISRISETGRLIARSMPWKRKPLPPVPTIPHIPIAVENQSRLEDALTPLPELAARADMLNGLLEKGYHPHHSVDTYYGGLPKEGSRSSEYSGSDGYVHVQDGRRNTRSEPPYQQNTSKPATAPNPNKKRYLIALAVFVVVAAAAIGAGVGVSVSHKSSASLPVCTSSNTTGVSCDLDATCVCTSTGSGQCNGLAQSIVNLTSTMNQLFSTNYSLDKVYTAIWLADGSPTGGNCASQALLVDSPGLSMASSPNRTTWARSAMLWDLVQSQDIAAIQTLQSFTKGAPWSSLSSDGPITGQSSFSVTASGFTFDFAAQTLTQPAVSFTDNGQPTSEQISRVGSAAMSSLNRMYTYAAASSTQRSNALELYWVNVLGQKASDLSAFRSAVISSAILIPFDATYNASSQALANQMTNSTSQPFPVPLACYPGLNNTQMQQINEIEQTVYGLSAAPAATSFNTSCYSDRPLYGILDVLRLRLPFIDSRTGVATQAASLQHDVGPRAIIRSGEVLSALPLSSNASDFTASTSNPRDYGTLTNIDHVLLDYLSSIPDVSVATALVSFLTSTTNAVPPSNTSTLANSIATIPSLEVAVFGSVLPSDIGSVVSSFVTPTGALFFGSAQGQSMRDWAIIGTGTSVVWAESALSSQVARDSSLTDTTFEDIWNTAALAIDNNVQNVGVSNITSSLQSTGQLSS
ncbi:hypothetical protein FB446DRAFT_680110 [Lentinula raphanica]|nr:hypothetical protein FB446DRAFT_680110 [Lentinula raphanica]